jgi:hypothetical protein
MTPSSGTYGAKRGFQTRNVSCSPGRRNKGGGSLICGVFRKSVEIYALGFWQVRGGFIALHLTSHMNLRN